MNQKYLHKEFEAAKDLVKISGINVYNQVLPENNQESLASALDKFE